jgi:hypothetical protein
MATLIANAPWSLWKFNVHEPMNALACDASSWDCAEAEPGSASAATTSGDDGHGFVLRAGVLVVPGP